MAGPDGADTIRRVAIIGGGFSGAMLAARLAERGVASALIDRSGSFGPGLAYSTGVEAHVLNVRANRMSAIEGRPDDFVRWLEANHPDRADPEGFAPRWLYGLYVRDRLERTEADRPGLIDRVTGEAVAMEETGVRLADGRTIRAGAVVLATGNPAPRTVAQSKAGRVIDDPWAAGALERIGPDDDILILGTGLTMVDVVLALEARGWRGGAIALSRRGRTPHAHGARHDAPVAATPALTCGPLARRLAEGRRLATANGWRGVMEGLRPLTADLWAQADTATRARFLRHLRPWWDVHRHRIAEPVAGELDRLTAAGRLTVVAGRVRGMVEGGDGVSLDWRPRDGTTRPPLTGRWLIDCTGPGHDAANNPLTRSLLEAGRARMDPSGLGLEVDTEGRVRVADGTPDERLYVLGPPARAAFWETVAVPDIRRRIEAMAARLATQASASR